MTSKSDSIGVTCTRLRHFADTFSQWNSRWKKLTLRHMTENKCGYQMHIFVTSFSAQHASAWRCFCMVQPLRQPFRPKCTNRILQMHHPNPVVPSESDVHPQNPVCTYSVELRYSLGQYWPGVICLGFYCTKRLYLGKQAKFPRIAVRWNRWHWLTIWRNQVPMSRCGPL